MLIALHDVAPSTWPFYSSFVAQLDRTVPLSLLLVPDFHHTGLFTRDARFVSALEQRIARGDEVVLHGYFHEDEGAPPRTPRDLLRRRVFTREAEFDTLSYDSASRRLRDALKIFGALGWSVSGFVPPGWLMNDPSKAALQRLPFSYTTSRRYIYRLPTYLPIAAPGLVWSARSALRRGTSLLWNEWQRWHFRAAPVVRLGLHPIDLRHAVARNYWARIIERLLLDREPLTKRAWLARDLAFNESLIHHSVRNTRVEKPSD